MTKKIHIIIVVLDYLTIAVTNKIIILNKMLANYLLIHFKNSKNLDYIRVFTTRLRICKKTFCV